MLAFAHNDFHWKKTNLAIYDHAAVGVKTLPGDETAVLTGQEDETCCDLRRLAGAAHGSGAQCVLGVMLHR